MRPNNARFIGASHFAFCAAVPRMGEAFCSPSTVPLNVLSWRRSLFMKTRSRRRLLLENLDSRVLLASDLTACALESPTGQPAALVSQTVAEGESVAEGEPARDLVAFAKQLTASGAVLYSASWAPSATEQLALFGDAARYLNVVEAFDINHQITQAGSDASITAVPTWIFENGSRVEGVTSVDDIANASGIFIPAGVAPSFFPVADQTVGIGSPLLVPIDSYDPNADALTITVTSSDPNLLEATIANGNPSVRFSIANFGDMVFELLQDRVPDAAQRVIDLVDRGFYDALDIHRIVPDRLVQFGDRSGTGAGSSSLGPIDDQFHADLQYNRPGVLGFAKTANDDSGDAQLFITSQDERRLDFQYPVVGQLIEGENVYAAINSVPVDAFGAVDAEYQNLYGPLTIERAEIFTDVQNRLLMLKPTGAGTGSVTVEVTVEDGEGNQSQQAFTVFVSEDNFQTDNNAAPFLDPIDTHRVAAGEQIDVQLTATDVEQDAVAFDAYRLGVVPYEYSIDAATGLLHVSPPGGFVGELEIFVGVRRSESAPSLDPNAAASDLQRLRIVVESTPGLALNLEAASDTGTSTTDNLTASLTPSFTVTGTQAGATVDLMIGDQVIATQTADSEVVRFADVDISAIDDGPVSLQVTQTLDSVVTMLDSPLQIVLDRVAPTQSNLVTDVAALATRPLVLNIQHDEEGTGLVYDLVSGPSGLTLDPATGRIEWTPTVADVGTQQTVIRYLDPAGNTFEETLTIDVAGVPQGIFEFSITDLSGAAIDQLVQGDEFLLNVQIVDNRLFASRHVFSAYLDLIFDSSLAVPVASEPITFGENFSFATSGSVSGNLIDELGGVSDLFSARTQQLASIRMQAIAPGLFLAVGSAPAGIGHELLMVDSSAAVPLEEIDFGRLEVSIAKLPQPIQLAFGSTLVADEARDSVSNLTATTETNGLVDVWADLNRNGSFDDPGEHLVSDFPLDNTSAVVPFVIPAGTTAGNVEVVYGITADGNLLLSDADRISDVPVLDSAGLNPIVVTTDGLAIDVATTVDDELLVQRDGVTVFRGSGASSITLLHGDGDSQITLNDLTAVLPADAAFSIQAGGGRDMLNTSGWNRLIDLTGISHQFTGIEQISVEDASELHIDQFGFTTLAPSGDRLDLTINDLNAFQLSGPWSLDSSEIIAAGLLRNLIAGDATLGLLGGPGWTNPFNPLDVNGSGTVEPIDALNILNELTRKRFIDATTNTLPDPTSLAIFPNRFYDTNRDGRVTPIDALRVINRLSIGTLGGEQFSQLTRASGEAAAIHTPAPQVDRPEKDDDELDAALVDAYFS